MTDCPIALVTGSSRGLGKAVAETLASQGFSVAIHYAGNREAAEKTAAGCQEKAANPNQRFEVVQGDLGQSAQRDALLGQVLEKFGHIDALVNNAGIAPRQRNDIVDATEESFDEVLDVNLKGPYFLTQSVARYWLGNRDKARLPGGYKLVFVTSISADTASVARGEYCISKAGLAMAAQLWAARLAEEGIQVNEVRPGIMETDMTSTVKEKYDPLIRDGLVPQRRWGQPGDVGAAVLSLLQGDWSFSTGSVIHVDGGFHLRRL